MHREYESLQNSGYSTQELRRDIAAMEEERDLVTRRIERMKQRVDDIPNHDAMLTSASSLRLAREKEKELSQQEAELKSSIQVTEQRIERFHTQLNDLRKASMGTTPEGNAIKIQITNFILKNLILLNLKVIDCLKAKFLLSYCSFVYEKIESFYELILFCTVEINNLK